MGLAPAVTGHFRCVPEVAPRRFDNCGVLILRFNEYDNNN